MRNPAPEARRYTATAASMIAAVVKPATANQYQSFELSQPATMPAMPAPGPARMSAIRSRRESELRGKNRHGIAMPIQDAISIASPVYPAALPSIGLFVIAPHRFCAFSILQASAPRQRRSARATLISFCRYAPNRSALFPMSNRHQPFIRRRSARGRLSGSWMLSLRLEPV